MRPITVSKEQLRQKLEENRAEHHKIFEEAVEGYRDEAIRQLNDHVERIKANNKVVRISVYVMPPEDHTADYDAAIQMIKWADGSKIELDEKSFRNFVLNDWDWTQSFLHTNSMYSMSARLLNTEDDD